MPRRIQGLATAVTTRSGWCRSTTPKSPMPRFSRASPTLPKHITANSTRYFCTFTGLVPGTCLGLGSYCFGFRTRTHFLGGAITLRAQLQERFRFLVQPLAFGGVKSGLTNNAEDGFGTEIVFVVELVHHLQDVLTGQAGILNLRQLVAAIIEHALVAHD